MIQAKHTIGIKLNCLSQICVNTYQNWIFLDFEVTERNNDNLSKSFLETEDDHRDGDFKEWNLTYPPKVHKKIKFSKKLPEKIQSK